MSCALSRVSSAVRFSSALSFVCSALSWLARSAACFSVASSFACICANASETGSTAAAWRGARIVETEWIWSQRFKVELSTRRTGASLLLLLLSSATSVTSTACRLRQDDKRSDVNTTIASPILPLAAATLTFSVVCACDAATSRTRSPAATEWSGLPATAIVNARRGADSTDVAVMQHTASSNNIFIILVDSKKMSV